MYKKPDNSSFPLILINAKSASSIASLLFAIVLGPCLIYVANAVTDGAIALGVFLLNRKMRESSR
jgi:hypothetical protein